MEALFKGDDIIPTWTLAVDYPAVVFTSPAETYLNSLAAGVKNLYDQINNTIAECPASNLVLVGYSQGAHVIGNVLAGVGTPPLSQNARDHILSVALFGDPTYRAGEPYNAAGSGAANGLFARPAGELSSWTRLGYPTPDTMTPVPVPIIRSYCYTGDAFCQNAGLGDDAIDVHESYDSTATGDAYFFLRDFIFDFNRRHLQTPSDYEESTQ